MKRFRGEIRKKSEEENWPVEKRIELEVFNNHLNGDWKRQSFYRPTIQEIAQVARYNAKCDRQNRFNSVMAYQLIAE